MPRNKIKNILLLKQIHSAVAQIKKGKLDKALETLDKAEKSARKAQSTDALYYILFTRGGILYTAKEYDRALETYEKALDFGSKLLETDPKNADYQHYMGTTLSKMGNLYKKNGKTQAAAEAYGRAREIYASLLALMPENALFRASACENLHNYGLLLTENGSLDGACEIFQEAVESYGKLILEKPENLGYQADLALSLSLLGSCQKQAGGDKTEQARQNLEKALKIQEKIQGEQPENEKIKEALALTHSRLEGL